MHPHFQDESHEHFGPGHARERLRRARFEAHGEFPTPRARRGGPRGKGHGFPGGHGGPGFPGMGPGGFPFGGFEFGMAGRGHGRGRQRRGDVRAAVLALLAERPMHGYEMIREISERSGGAWRPSPGSVYPLLQQLADEELVTEAEGSGSKRLFTLTDKGTGAAAEFTENPPWNQAAEDVPAGEHEFRTAAKQLMVAMWQAPAAASAEQVSRITEIINETRRKIYAVLSEDAPAEGDAE